MRDNVNTLPKPRLGGGSLCVATICTLLMAQGCGDLCGPGTSQCGEVCVDTQVDPRNCGKCNIACDPGQACSAGTCVLSCQSGLSSCKQTCVDLQTDNANCGKCGEACKQGMNCSKGVCALACPSDLTQCGGTCVDLQTSNANCGKCGDACKPGQVCSKGACALTCQGTLNNCGGACVDLQASNANCGKCGTACKAGQVCSKGSCALTCQAGLTDCKGRCVDLQDDNANCGKCGAACKAGQICSKGACALTCQSGLTDCKGTCFDLKASNANCGKCGQACKPGQICSAGKCTLTCQSGLTDCSNTCVNLYTDATNCGKCGAACAVKQICVNGVCSSSCGNNKIDPGEQCEGNQLGGKACKDLGFKGGVLACGNDCYFLTSKCFKCGDFVLNGSEECDGLQLGNKTCQSKGFGSGTLACKACKLDDAGCVSKNDTCKKAQSLTLTAGQVKVTGSTSHATNTAGNTKAGCKLAWDAPGPEVFYAVKLSEGMNYQVSLTPASGFDGMVYAVTDCDKLSSSCLGAKDKPGAGKAEVLVLSPKTTGTVYLVVDSYKAGHAGSFALEVRMVAPGAWSDLPAGTFWMGAWNKDKCRQANESLHQVTLKRGFRISRTEVTQSQYLAIMGTNKAYHSNCKQCPVERVTWHEAAKYCNALSKLTGLQQCYSCVFSGLMPFCQPVLGYKNGKIFDCPGYRLPTEAEWEYAYRANTPTGTYVGDLVECSYTSGPYASTISWNRYTSQNKTWPVGLRTPNKWKLYDMAGNVYEWCHDWYVADLGSSPQTDPWGLSSGTARVIRGGSYLSYPGEIRASYRLASSPKLHYKNVGFRCVKSAVKP